MNATLSWNLPIRQHPCHLWWSESPLMDTRRCVCLHFTSTGGRDMGRMDGKVALITGAARGQGRSHAVRLAQEGADVVVLDLPDTASFEGLDYPLPASGELDETVEQVRATGRHAIAVRG